MLKTHPKLTVFVTMSLGTIVLQSPINGLVALSVLFLKEKKHSLTESNLEAVSIQVSPGKKLYTGCSLLTSLTLHV